MSFRVGITILNWNNYKDTLQCLRSLLDSTYPLLEIIVCDNGSNDNSLQEIENWVREKGFMSELKIPDFNKKRQIFDVRVLSNKSCAHKIYLLNNHENLGFAKGNNRGAKLAILLNCEYVFLLNNDLTVDKECIGNLVKFGEKRKDAALMGVKLFEINKLTGKNEAISPQSIIHPYSFAYIMIFRTFFGRFFSKDLKNKLAESFHYYGNDFSEIYYAHGCAMMFRASALKKINFFDEKTFLYWEEFIVAEKLRKNKLLTFHVPTAIINHKHARSTKKISSYSRYSNSLLSEKYYIKKYLRIRSWKLKIIEAVRILAYLKRVPSDRDYRKNAVKFFLSYLKI
jgi:GT2 family glycosyltransferase